MRMLTGSREILPMPCVFQCRQRMEKSFAAVAGVELLQRLEFVVHFQLSSSGSKGHDVHL